MFHSKNQDYHHSSNTYNMAEAGEVCDVMKKFCELDTQIFLSVTEIRKGKGRADNTSILKNLY